MSPTVPHAWPLRRRHEAFVAVAVALQVFAVTRVSPWFPPSWCAVLAVAVGLAWLPAPRLRSVVFALALRVALVIPALLLAGQAIEGLVARGVTTSLYPRSSTDANLVTAALWLCAMHAPVIMTRWWVRASPAQDAALELAESLGASLTAAALALTVQNAPRAWSVALGTAWSTGVCLAVGLVLLAGALVEQARRSRWLRRVREGTEPSWRLVTAEASDGVVPWTHAAEGDVPTEMLSPSAAGEHYRSADVRVPVAGVGGRTSRAWWVRRALNGVALAWAFGTMFFGMWKLMHVWPDVPAVADPEGVALRRAAALSMQPDTTVRVPHRMMRVDWGWNLGGEGALTFRPRTGVRTCYDDRGMVVFADSAQAMGELRRALDVVSATRGWAPEPVGWSLHGVTPFAGQQRLLRQLYERLCPMRLSGVDE